MRNILLNIPNSNLIPDETALEDYLSEPTDTVSRALAQVPGDLLLLGVGGKMGPSLARMIRRASEAVGDRRRIIGVSRFTQGDLEAILRRAGIETIRGDLLDESVIRSLPEAPNVVFMTGLKFGSTGDEPRMWTMNTLLPARLAERFSNSRWLIFSTGNVYAMTSPPSGGAVESERPEPVGEYGMSCLGRERIFEHGSRIHGTPMSIVRLNYACDLRYGVLVDLAQQVWATRPVDLTMGYFNTIWQGDANALALLALAQATSPPFLVNLTGPETLGVREVCEIFGEQMGRPVTFVGQESKTALLSNAHKALNLLGPPRISADTLIRWVAHWVMAGNPTLGKPTGFEKREGQF
jgi:nucleoside-diphosphate-sugar epimerase